MNSGPQSAAQPQPSLGADDSFIDYAQDPYDRLPRWQEAEEAAAPEEEIPEAEPAPRGQTLGWVIGGLLVLLAVAWLGAVGWVYGQRPLPQDPAEALNLVALSSAPLALLALLWLILGHSPRRRTDRFSRAVERMRGESRALESVLDIVASKLDENYQRLSGEAARLMTLGDEASDRIGRVAHYLAREREGLDKQAEALEGAAANARVDIGVLLHDLPRAEEQARGMAQAMREAGLSAHQQAGQLEGQLAALSARGREADEVVGGAAQRLGAHLARVESTAASATDKLDEATLGMTAAIDGAMARAAEAIDHTRMSLDAQGAAMLATVEQSRAALAGAGDEAARSLSQRLERIGVKIEGLAGQIASQDEASRALITRLGQELADLDVRFATLREGGTSGAAQLQESFTDVRALAQSLIGELGGGQDRAAAMIAQIEAVSAALSTVQAQLDEDVPAALERVETQAERTRVAAGGLAPEVSAIESSADAALAKLAEAESSIGRQREALEVMVERLRQELSALDVRIGSLRDAGVSGADRLQASFATVGEAAQQLIRDLEGGEARSGALLERFAGLRQSVAALSEEFEEPVAGALARVEEQAQRTHGTIGDLVPTVAAIEASSEVAAARLIETEAAVARQREAVELLLSRLDEGTEGAEERLRALGAAANEADAAAAKLTRDTGPELIEALVRVREAASQAAERAREAIASAIPESAAALADASRRAVAEAISGPVEQQMGELVKVAEAAVETARHASERLTRQLLTIGETAAAIEDRFDASRREHDERERETLSRHVSLLTESLNSAAIDVTKILSNDVTDDAWAAYLRGDRGIFTRRAVRLLGNSESRDILRHYEEEPDFREHVNRYIHDFESMMRRVLADREGSALGVTILSSDMGKLYVALAQAIERLRR